MASRVDGVLEGGDVEDLRLGATPLLAILLLIKLVVEKYVTRLGIYDPALVAVSHALVWHA